MRIYALSALLNLAAACSNILVTPGCSSDGSPQIAYAADDGGVFGHLRHFPAGVNPPGTMMKVWDWDSGTYLGEIDNSGVRYNVVGNMNEHGLIIGETTFGGLESLSSQSGAKIDYGTLIWTTLTRVKTAREAIHTMYNLTQQYGYYSTGETFSIADTKEVWIMELIGKGEGEKGGVFVARRIPDGYMSSHANQARIRTWDWSDKENNIWAADVVSFAKAKGLYKGGDEDFSFSDVYDPVTFSGARLGEARAWSVLMTVAEDRNFGNKYLDYAQGHNLTNRMPLWVKPFKKISVNDTMWLMRTHFDGTWFDESKDVGAGAFHARYRQRPLVWEHAGKQYVNERTIGVQQTGWNFVAHSRGSYLPKEVGPVIWFGVDDTSTCVHFPAYANSRGVPSTWAKGTSGSATEFVLRGAFWVFNLVANFAYSRWEPVFPVVQEKIVELERQYMTELEAMDQTLVAFLSKGQTGEAMETLTQFTIATGDGLVDTWVQFWMDLFVKYRDGFVITPAVPKHPQDKPVPNCAETGFDDAWRKRIVDEAGPKYLVWNASGPTGQLTAQDHHKLKFIK